MFEVTSKQRAFYNGRLGANRCVLTCFLPFVAISPIRTKKNSCLPPEDYYQDDMERVGAYLWHFRQLLSHVSCLIKRKPLSELSESPKIATVFTRHVDLPNNKVTWRCTSCWWSSIMVRYDDYLYDDVMFGHSQWLFNADKPVTFPLDPYSILGHSVPWGGRPAQWYADRKVMNHSEARNAVNRKRKYIFHFILLDSQSHYWPHWVCKRRIIFVGPTPAPVFSAASPRPTP